MLASTAKSPTEERLLREAVLATLRCELARQSSEREMRSDELTFAADTDDILKEHQHVKLYGSLDVNGLANILVKRFIKVLLQREEIFAKMLHIKGHS